MRIDGRTDHAEWKHYDLPLLAYPRVHQICLDSRLCSEKLTLFELLLTREDVAEFAPGLEERLPDVERWRTLYGAGRRLSVVAPGEPIAGFDEAGFVYVARQQPDLWLESLRRGEAN
jgi:hypothetical protein